jgi:hypothetical protein
MQLFWARGQASSPTVGSQNTCKSTPIQINALCKFSENAARAVLTKLANILRAEKVLRLPEAVVSAEAGPHADQTRG